MNIYDLDDDSLGYVMIHSSMASRRGWALTCQRFYDVFVDIKKHVPYFHAAKDKVYVYKLAADYIQANSEDIESWENVPLELAFHEKAMVEAKLNWYPCDAQLRRFRSSTYQGKQFSKRIERLAIKRGRIILGYECRHGYISAVARGHTRFATRCAMQLYDDGVHISRCEVKHFHSEEVIEWAEKYARSSIVDITLHHVTGDLFFKIIGRFSEITMKQFRQQADNIDTKNLQSIISSRDTSKIRYLLGTTNISARLLFSMHYWCYSLPDQDWAYLMSPPVSMFDTIPHRLRENVWEILEVLIDRIFEQSLNQDLCKLLREPARKYLRADDYTLEQQETLFTHAGICLRGKTLESTTDMLGSMMIICQQPPEEYISDLIYGISRTQYPLDSTIHNQLLCAAKQWNSDILAQALAGNSRAYAKQ